MRLLKDPLFVVIGIGFVLFFVDKAIKQDSFDDFRIVLGNTEVENIATQWTQSIGRAPTNEELETLVDAYLDEEVLVREALRMGLDQNDVVIRRRLALRARLLLEDRVAIKPAESADLLQYFEDHKNNYRTAEQISFSHVFFSPERREDSEADARIALLEVNNTNWKQFGDTFLLQNSYTEANLDRIRRDFGSRFSTNISKLENGLWNGPIQSVYGSHLVRISSRNPSKEADFESVSAKVKKDLEFERQNYANEAYFEQLRDQYTIEIKE